MFRNHCDQEIIILYDTIIEILTKYIDLPRPNKPFTPLLHLMSSIFSIFDSKFLKELPNTTMNDVINKYQEVFEYVTNLKKDSTVAKYNNDWDTVYSIADELKSIDIKWDPILVEYYFSKLGKYKYLNMVQSITNLVTNIHNKVNELCVEFTNNVNQLNNNQDKDDYEDNMLVITTRLSWSLECLICSLGEIYKI